MNNLDNKKLTLFELLIDDRCEMYGIRNTIAFLMDNDFTADELLEMYFDEDDVNYVFAHPDEDFNLE